MVPAASSAASTMRSPRATPPAAFCQNVSALDRVIGSMKLTEAPLSTQSMRTSLKPPSSRSPIDDSGRMLIELIASSPRRARMLGREHHDVACGFAGAIAIGRWLVELHREAIVLGQPVGDAADGHLDAAGLDP